MQKYLKICCILIILSLSLSQHTYTKKMSSSYDCYRDMDQVYSIAWYCLEINLTRVNDTLNSLRGFCFDKYVAEVQDGYDRFMVFVGFIIALMSLVCGLIIAADLWSGFRKRKYWFPIRYFLQQCNSYNHSSDIGIVFRQYYFNIQYIGSSNQICERCPVYPLTEH